MDMTWGGEWLDAVPADWWCDVHGRHLTYPEWRAGACFICRPEKIPIVTVRNTSSGKPSATLVARKKLYERIRALSAEERDALASRARRNDAQG
jgi:hypothetical protein